MVQLLAIQAGREGEKLTKELGAGKYVKEKVENAYDTVNQARKEADSEAVKKGTKTGEIVINVSNNFCPIT